MRGRLSILMLLMLALVSVIGLTATQAKPVEELNKLAGYYPADTSIFATIRTDDGYVETLNGVIDLVRQNTNGNVPADLVLPPVAELIDQVAFQGAAEANGIPLNWIGETAAFGMWDFDADNILPSVLLAVEITDRAAAETFIELTSADFGFEREDADGFTRFSVAGSVIGVSDDVMLVAETDVILDAAFAEDDSLADVTPFGETLAALPAESYNATLYIDLTPFIDLLFDTIERLEAEGLAEPGTLDLISMGEIPGIKLALGATILDGRTFTLDMAARADDPAAFAEAMGGSPVQTPLNLDLAERLPAYTQLLLWDADMASSYDGMIESLNMMGEGLQPLIDLAAAEEMDPDTRQFLEMLDLTTINFGGLVENTLIPVFAGLTGLNFEDDIIDWMTGDFMLTTSLLPVDGPLTFTLDITYLATDPDGGNALAVVAQLADAAEAYNLDPTTEDLGEDGFSLVIPELLPLLLGEDGAGLPDFILEDAPALDFMIAADDDLLAVGSRPGVEAAIVGRDVTLAQNPVYAYAASVFLPEPTAVAYLSGTDLADALRVLGPAFGAPPEGVNAVQALVAQVESMTISSSTPSDQINLARLTITLPEGVAYEIPAPEGMTGMGGSSIADVAASTEGFSLLTAALAASNLTATLDGEGPLTVFAPTDDAFLAALDSLDLTADELLAEPDLLAEILKYHVLLGDLDSSEVPSFAELGMVTLQGDIINVSVDGDRIVLNNSANIVLGDLTADNGVIHVIDAVLIPPSLQRAIDAISDRQASATPEPTPEVEPAATEEAEEGGY